MRSTAWTDDRLDDLNHKVDRIDQRIDQRFNAVDARFNEMETRMDARFNEMGSRFDSLQRTLLQAAVAMSVSFLTAGAAIVATQI